MATRATKTAVTYKKIVFFPCNKSCIDQACLVKMAGYWPRCFLARFWTLTASSPIDTQKKNLANIQPSFLKLVVAANKTVELDAETRGTGAKRRKTSVSHKETLNFHWLRNGMVALIG